MKNSIKAITLALFLVPFTVLADSENARPKLVEVTGLSCSVDEAEYMLGWDDLDNPAYKYGAELECEASYEDEETITIGEEDFDIEYECDGTDCGAETVILAWAQYVDSLTEMSNDEISVDCTLKVKALEASKTQYGKGNGKRQNFQQESLSCSVQTLTDVLSEDDLP